VGHYQPRHSSHEVEPPDRKRRRPLVVVAAIAGTAIVAAAIAVPLMAGGGGGGGGSGTTGQAASPATTQHSTTPVASSASTGHATNHVSTRGAGSPGSATTDSTRVVTTTTASTTTTRPQVNPAASRAPAADVAAPDGFGQLIQTLWVDAHPGGVAMSGADVASVLPGSVFYSEQPAIGTFWAIARFVPSAQAQSESGTAAGNALLAQFSTTAIFVKVPGETWHYLGAFTTTACGQGVPGPVLSAWGMCGP
jgi:hypothetical protein